MGAIRLAVRAELRRHRLSRLLVAILVGVTGAAAIVATTSARRSSTSYARFLVWSNATDLSTGGAESDEELARVIDALADAPFTEASARGVGLGRAGDPAEGIAGCCWLRGPSGRMFAPFQIFAAAGIGGDMLESEVDRAKVIDGRLPDPSSPDEVVADFGAADDLDAEIGDQIEVVADDGSTIAVTLVGTVAAPGTFPTLSGASFRGVVFTDAFREQHPDLFEPGNASIGVRLRPEATRAEVEQWIEQNATTVDIFETATTHDGIERAIAVETNSTWVIAGLLALVFVVLVGQLVYRQALSARPEHARLREVGFRRGDLVMLGAASASVIGVCAAAVAAGVAALASGFTPVGLAQIAEPEPGIRLDWPVLLAGAVAVVAVVATLGAATTWWVQRSARRVPRAPQALVPLPSSKPTVMVGTHFLLRPAGAGEARAGWAAGASMVVLTVSLVACVVVFASLQNVTADPQLSGATWDVAVAPQSSSSEYPTVDDVARTRRLVEDADSVVTTALTSWSSVELGEQRQSAMAQVFEDGGRIGPAIARGRAPVEAGEVALGGDLMESLDLSIGDEIELRGSAQGDGGGAASGDVVVARVVGVSVLTPPIFFPGGAGDGVAMPAATGRLLGGDAATPPSIVIARFEAGTDVALATTRMINEVPSEITFGSADRTVSAGIVRVQTLPRALIVVLGLGCAGAIVHLLATAQRRRRHDIAVVRMLGLTSGQLRGATALHALGSTAAILVLGVPLGIVAGRLAWQQSASFLGVVPVVVISGAVLVAAVGIVAMGQIAAQAAAWWTDRRRPVELLQGA
jgi:hypothetical protein